MVRLPESLRAWTALLGALLPMPIEHLSAARLGHVIVSEGGHLLRLANQVLNAFVQTIARLGEMGLGGLVGLHVAKSFHQLDDVEADLLLSDIFAELCPRLYS